MTIDYISTARDNKETFMSFQLTKEDENNLPSPPPLNSLPHQGGRDKEKDFSEEKRICIHIPYNKLIEHIDLVVSRRLNLEILFDANTLDRLTQGDIERLKERLDYAPLITFHAPFMDLSPGSMDSLIRRATRERFDQILQISSIIHPAIIVFHPGINKWIQDDNREEWLKKSTDFWQSFLKEAIRYNITIAIENIFDEGPEFLYRLIKAIHSPLFGLCLDIGHYNLFSKVSLEEWFGCLNDRIIEIHLHDNNGKEDDHLGIGEGEIDFDLLFILMRRYKINPLLTIEAHSKEAIERSLIKLAP